jgi:Tetratricopeptide repeat
MKMRMTQSLVYLFFSFATPIALAQQTPPASGNLEQAMRLYDEAEIHYQLQEWEKALEKYKEAYRLSREPEMLFNIGQCYRMLKKYDEAVKSYNAFQREVPNSPQHANVEALIAKTEQEKKQAAAQAPLNPTTAPATQTVIIREVAASLPALQSPPREGLDSASALYIGSVSAMAGSLIVGGLALSNRISQDRAAVEEDATSFQGFHKKAITFGIFSDVLVVTALATGALSYKRAPKRRVPFALYGTAGASALIAVGCGATALSASKKASSTSDSVESLFQKARANDIGNVADLLFVTAVVSGGLGVLLQLKAPKAEVTVTPNIGGVTLSKKF